VTSRRFFSLAALNGAIRDLLVDLNDRTVRGWSRHQLFDGARAAEPRAAVAMRAKLILRNMMISSGFSGCVLPHPPIC
jgi:hypothetical protein